jgi:hypothetical protein
MGLQIQAASCIVYAMADQNHDLKTLLKAERAARGRYEQLRGYPADEQAKALALWQEATEAVREYRSSITSKARH